MFRSGGKNKVINIELFLSNLNPNKSILSPGLSERVFDHPVVTFIIFSPSHNFDSLSSLDFQGSFFDFVNSFFIGQKVSVDGHNSNDGSIIHDFSFDGFFSSQNTVFLHEKSSSIQIFGAFSGRASSVIQGSSTGISFFFTEVKGSRNRSSFASLSFFVTRDHRLDAQNSSVFKLLTNSIVESSN